MTTIQHCGNVGDKVEIHERSVDGKSHGTALPGCSTFMIQPTKLSAPGIMHAYVPPRQVRGRGGGEGASRG